MFKIESRISSFITFFYLVEEFEEDSDKKQSLRYTYGAMITKFIRYTPFDSHIDLNEL